MGRTMPIHLPQCAGEPYRPSNGTEGMMFEAEFCDRCKHDDECRRTGNTDVGCRIYLHVLCYEVTDPEYPVEWVFDALGHPICTAFEDVDTGGDDEKWPAPIEPDLNQMMFDWWANKRPMTVAERFAIETDRMIMGAIA